MTKKKPGAKRTGRPKGTGLGLTEIASTTLTPDVSAAVDAEAAARGTTRAVVLREIIERWAKRRKPPAE